MTVEFPQGLNILNLICEFTIKSSLILAVSLLLAFLFRKRSASIRHFILSFSLISLLLFPFLASFTPGWKTRWLPSWQIEKNAALSMNDSEINKDPLIHLNQKNDPRQANSVYLSDLDKAKHQDEKTIFFVTSDMHKLLSLGLIVIWISGLIFLLTRIFFGIYGASRLKRQGKRISGSLWDFLLQSFLKAVSIKRKISLLIHDQVKAPLTWGVIKPTVIMPAETRNWTKDQCSSALFHELSHIKRNDFLIKILAFFICSLYWFNPLSWFVFRVMKKEQEKACDELVLRAGVKPSTYAANLLSIKKAGHVRWTPSEAVLGAVGKSQLNERLLAILQRRLKPKEVKMKTKILLSFFIIAAIIFIGLARPSQSAASSETFSSDKGIVSAKAQNAQPSDDAQEKEEEKKSEKAEKEESKDKKDKKKKTESVFKDEEAHVAIVIDKYDKGKKIAVVKKPVVIIKKDLPDEGCVFTISGKDVVLKKDKKGHWTIKADKVHVIKEDEAKIIKIDKDKTFRIKIKKGKDGKKIIVSGSPEIVCEEHLHEKEDPDAECHSIHISGLKDKLFIAPHLSLQALPHLDMLPLFLLKTKHEKLKEKLEKLREKLSEIRQLEDETEKAEAQEEALKEIEEALSELSEELEKEQGKLKDLKILIKTDAKYDLADKLKQMKKIKKNISIDTKDDRKIIRIIDEGESYRVTIKSKLDSKNKGKYQETLEKLKKDLPENCSIESEIDEESHTAIIKITIGKKDAKSNEDVEKLAQEIAGELSKIEKE